MRIVLFGAPGSGKGTVGGMIESAYKFPRISTGDLLRKAVREGAPLGRQAEGIMAVGGLVPDEVVTSIVRDRIAGPDCRPGYVMDGYPRTIAQAEALAAIDGGRRELVVSLEVGLESLVERLAGRLVCPACGGVFHRTRKPPRRAGLCDDCGAELRVRADDAADVVRERIRVYESATAPLKAWYRERSDFRAIDGEGRAEEVFARVAAVLDAAGAVPAGGGAVR
jgi:adenylate kinase